MSKPRPKVAKFDPAAIIRESRSIKEVLDSELGLIRYMPLTCNDIAEIGKSSDLSERGLEMIYRMLKPCYAGLTRETIKLFPSDVYIRLLNSLGNKNNFLTVEPKDQASETVDHPKGEVP